LQGCLLTSFLTKAFDAVTAVTSGQASPSYDELLRNEIKVDFFLPVLDTVYSNLTTRFNEDCVAVLTHLSAVMTMSIDFDNSVKKLCAIAKLDADLCIAEGKLLFCNAEYKSADTICSLQCFATKMVTLQHSILYKNFYALINFLLTLPVTSASCERAHSKVDIVKSAVRASMTSERLEDLILISSEKVVLDNIDLSTIVDKFAADGRALPL